MATYNIFCRLSGLQIGQLDLLSEAGRSTYFKAWNSAIVEHPIFSLPTHQLLAFARAEWKRLAKPSIDGETTEREDIILRVAFLAVLHSLDSVRQDIPALPPLHVVQNNMGKLFALAYWKFYLDSKRFRFPAYRISKHNENADFKGIGDYLEVCFELKTLYEEGLQDADEEKKLADADRALKKLKSSWIAPPSNKELYRWVRSNLPAKYEADAQGWMATIFLGKEKAILSFDKDEIMLLQDIILSECPAGTGMLHAVSVRLNEIEKIYTDNKEAFTVDFEDFDIDTPLANARAASTAPESVVQPKQSDYPTKVAFIRANALWYLQQRKAVGSNTVAGTL